MRCGPGDGATLWENWKVTELSPTAQVQQPGEERGWQCGRLVGWDWNLTDHVQRRYADLKLRNKTSQQIKQVDK